MTENRTRHTRVPGIVKVFSAIHFLVDLACVFLMTAFLIPVLSNRTEWVWCVLMYNMFAFAFQLPVGALGDGMRNPGLLSAAGCCLAGTAFFLTPVPLAASIAAGIGNACFHIGGGIEVLGLSRGKAALSGIYVSTGAFGVYLAPKLAAKGLGFFGPVRWAAALIMAACGVFLALRMRRETPGKTENSAGNAAAFCERGASENTREIKESCSPGTNRKILLAAVTICLAMTVCLRSYVGTILSFSWKSVELLALLFTAGIVFGKMLGGIIGDRFGWLPTTAVSLCGSAFLFLAAPGIPACGIAGVFLFNMTMPVTLAALANIYPENRGTAFGIATFALFIGVMPSIFGIGADIFPDERLGLFLCIASSLLLLTLGLKGYERYRSCGLSAVLPDVSEKNDDAFDDEREEDA